MSRISSCSCAAGALLFFAALQLSADYPGKTAPAGKESAAQLLVRKQELVRQRQQLKVKLIRNDLRLRRLRNQLIRLAKELALEVDSKPEIRKINEEIRQVESSIRKLQNGKSK